MSEIVDHIDVVDGEFLMSRHGYYFGYGLESVPEVMDEILGRSVTAETGAIAIGQQLLVQEVDQIPDEPTEQLGGQSPQQIIKRAWQSHTEAAIASYVLWPTDARSSTVTGTLYEIDLDDGIRLVDWNLSLPFEHKEGKIFWPGWKAWNHSIELVDGRKVETLTIDTEQPIDRIVDGNSYDPFLIDQQTTLRVIQDFVDGLSK